MRKLLIKMCGLRTQADLDATGGGNPAADFCGFVFHPSSPRYIAPEAVAKLDSHGLLRVGVFVEHNAAAVARAATLARLDCIQLHGGQTPENGRELRARLEESCGHAVRIIRVFWPDRFASLDALQNAMDAHASYSDFFLLDAGLSGGGNGQRLDWYRLARLQSPLPWFLAGGLGPDNSAEALAAVQRFGNGPDGIDLNSGLENAPGCKDPDRIRQVLHLLKPESSRNAPALNGRTAP